MNSKVQLLISLVAGVIAVISLFFSYDSGNKIAYVESSRLLTSYQGMLDASQVYQEKAKVWQSNIDTLRSELQGAINKYESEKSTLTKRERELNEELLGNKQKQLVDYQRSIEEKAREEDQKMTQAVLTKVNSFLKQYGEDNGYDIIMGATESGNIVYTSEGYNITDIVLTELNKEYGN